MRVLKLAVFTLLGLHYSAHAGRSVIAQETQTGRRVIAEFTPGQAGAAEARFYSCETQAGIPVVEMNLQACDAMIDGKPFTLARIHQALAEGGQRSPLRFVFEDTVYGSRSAWRWLIGQPLDGRRETTYRGSAESYNSITTNPGWFINALERALVGNSDEPGIVVGLGASGDFPTMRDAVTAALIYVQRL